MIRAPAENGIVLVNEADCIGYGVSAWACPRRAVPPKTTNPYLK